MAIPTGRKMRGGIVRLALAASAALCVSFTGAAAQTADNAAPAPVDAAPQETYERREGFLPLLINRERARLLVELPAADEDGVMARAIHSAGLTAGLGSNPVGLDRGAFDGGRIVAFVRIGDKVFLKQENWRYRASAENPAERRAVRESFAPSFLWAGTIERETDDGGVIVDLTSFLTSDVIGAGDALSAAGQGAFARDAGRSVVLVDEALAFPDNVEFDAVITLTSDDPGAEPRATAADGGVVTLKQHHSFVRLPDEGYKPRAFDPRVGAIAIPYYDFSAPLDEPIIHAFARRFRLERVDPSAAHGPVKKPIVFYVDSGAPPAVRDALVEGTRWWADAFDAAGFEDAFRVEILPDGAHPFDVRYNVIQWSHRQTRGWSYGGGIADPRTGEMLKAQVVLGSQRVRQDRMIFEGLAGAAKSGSGAADDPVELALARIRQLAAHEVGHTLGFAHNFAASAIDRASVMDYPAPYVRPTQAGALDFSKAYGVGVGAWDKHTTKWLYTEFSPNADEAAGLAAVVAEARAAGLIFADDREARPIGGAHPFGSLWDNGADPIAALDETMAVRAIALQRFGVDAVKPGGDLGALSSVIAPIYLYHRYQVQAAAKLIAGYDFAYAMNEAAARPAAPTPPADQRRALAAIVATLEPAALDLPDAVLDRLIPPAGEIDARGFREAFDGDQGPMFDLLAAADAAAGLTLSAVLHPARAARLIEMERRNPETLTLSETLQAIEAAVFGGAAAARQAEIKRTVQTRFISTLIDVAAGAQAAGETQAASAFVSNSGGAAAPASVRARIDAYLSDLKTRIVTTEHGRWLAGRIESHLNRAAPIILPAEPRRAAPPGSPIGSPIGSPNGSQSDRPGGLFNDSALTPFPRNRQFETCWHCETF